MSISGYSSFTRSINRPRTGSMTILSVLFLVSLISCGGEDASSLEKKAEKLLSEGKVEAAMKVAKDAERLRREENRKAQEAGASDYEDLVEEFIDAVQNKDFATALQYHYGLQRKIQEFEKNKPTAVAEELAKKLQNSTTEEWKTAAATNRKPYARNNPFAPKPAWATKIVELFSGPCSWELVETKASDIEFSERTITRIVSSVYVEVSYKRKDAPRDPDGIDNNVYRKERQPLKKTMIEFRVYGDHKMIGSASQVREAMEFWTDEPVSKSGN